MAVFFWGGERIYRTREEKVLFHEKWRRSDEEKNKPNRKRKKGQRIKSKGGGYKQGLWG